MLCFPMTDDFSETLDIYVNQIFGDKVKVYRNEQNLGLIKARLVGINQATGDVVVFMDSHAELQPRW